mmetsp:Transcript_56678/g.159017  ORF Transcript_56678/g.159017 Transcript_56678/m.159017 type:complete len:84 (-) Transcript_56678:286-537(-)
MSGAGSRETKSLVLRYNYFLNTLDSSLSGQTPTDTLVSQYQDLLTFIRGLSPDERRQIQLQNTDWSIERRKGLQDRCRDRGIL